MQDYIPDQTNIKCIHELPCSNLHLIQQQVLDWVDENTNFLQEKTDKGFWKKIDYKHLGKFCPSLLKFMASVKIPIREITVGLLTESMSTEGFVLHNGAPPCNFKINFPIFNTEDVWTEWYDIPKADMYALGTMINKHTGTEQYNFTKINNQVLDLYPCLLRYNMHDHPIVFNSYIPHRVIPGPNSKYPRIMLATMPVIDPIHLMMR